MIPKALQWTIIGPERIARSILAAIRHDRRESFVPWFYRPVAWLQALTPGLLARVLARGKYSGTAASGRSAVPQADRFTVS